MESIDEDTLPDVPNGVLEGRGDDNEFIGEFMEEIIVDKKIDDERLEKEEEVKFQSLLHEFIEYKGVKRTAELIFEEITSDSLLLIEELKKINELHQ